MTNDNKSLAHTKWNCKYHIVFAPKYRRKVFFGGEKGRDRKDPEAAMRVEGNRNPRSGSLSGSCAYAGEHTAEGIGIRFYGIPEGKEQSDDLRTVREPEIQV